ncbi:probable receptor-like protein kinase [Tanacetum coccineum]
MSIQIPLLFTILTTVVSAYTPTDHYLINCGTTTTTTIDPNRRTFTADTSSPNFIPNPLSKSLQFHNPETNLTISPIYTSVRVSPSPKPLVYIFKVIETGVKLVRLHFHKFEFGVKGIGCHDQFHVVANDYVLLYNFSTKKMGDFSTVVKDFMIWVDVDEIVIKFIPVGKSSYAFVNAIEVISAPDDLVQEFSYNKDDGRKHGYEMLYRVNVGGVKVTPFNDSLWRTWSPDEGFFKIGGSDRKVHFDGRIQYRVGGASREVCPDNVYNSARVVESLGGEMVKDNMTWVFPVEKGFSHLVRLHFCDIASISLGMMFFNVYVNGNLVYENLDLSTVTNYMLASPFYADFVVDGEKFVDVIRVDIGPSSLSKAHAVDGILNGLEIWKMDNAMKSLGGEVCASQLESKNQSGGQVSRLLSLTAAVCLLAIAFLVMRRKTEAKDTVGWSRVPSEIDLKSNYPKSTAV